MTLSRPAGTAVADSRGFWAHEATIWNRLAATWVGLDDAAWRLPFMARVGWPRGDEA
jgi:hypothetical protein